MHRILTIAVTTGALLLSGCGDTDGVENAATTTLATTTTLAPPEVEAPTVPDDWAEILVDAFDRYDEARQALDDETSRQLGEVGQQAEPTDQMLYDVWSELLDGLADAADDVTAALPAAVPDDVEAVYRATIDAHVALADERRRAAEALRDGDPEPYNALPSGAWADFAAACADLQFTVRDIGAGLLRCGIPGDDPEEREFVADATVVDGSDEFVAMPAGSHRLDYVAPSGSEPFVIIDLDYATERLIRTSVEIVEVAVAPAGPALRIHAGELVANPTQLGPDITDFWLIGPDPSGWIAALEGIAVVSEGTGDVGGLPARSWDLANERDEPVAILGDGTDWLPETTLEPGQALRLWAVDVDGRAVLVTLHGPAGRELDEFTDEFDELLGGLTLTPA